jgi:putative ATP-dependent endonuclease of the OLD family
MHLHLVRVRNFRGLKDVSISLAAGLNVLVGENNIGKTALLDAIRAALGPAANTGDMIKLGPEDRHRQADGVYLDQPILINLTFSDLSTDEQAQFIDILNYNAAEPDKSTAQLNFRWIWNEKTGHYSAHRWGGIADQSENSVPEDVLQTVPVTLLGALRDATASLLPGRNSRLAHLLEAQAAPKDREEIVAFGKSANNQLEKNALVNRTQELITTTLTHASGSIFAQKTSIKSSAPEFEKIIQGLRLVISKIGAGGLEVTDELRTNGLGFNNLFFIATVTLELNARKSALLPLLLVEEPEAHLHPQLQTLLADFLSDPKNLNPAKVQTIITSHSPTIAAHVKPEQLRVLHRGPDGALHCVALSDCGLKAPAFAQLRRMLDVTKASLLFSRGVILVEGITEALLLPVLARRLGLNLEENGISIVPVCGVDFDTIAQLFGDKGLRIRLSIVTDGDPGTKDDPEEDEAKGEDDAADLEPEAAAEKALPPWNQREPRRDATNTLVVCARVKKLLTTHAASNTIKIFYSDVTLEYSLALPAVNNSNVMYEAWAALFTGRPRTLTPKKLAACGDDTSLRALTVWRGICLADTNRSKAEFAQTLAARLDQKTETAEYAVPIPQFTVPEYIRQAFAHVLSTGAA